MVAGPDWAIELVQNCRACIKKHANPVETLMSDPGMFTLHL